MNSKSKIFTSYMQFMQRDFLSTLPVNNHDLDLADEDITLKAGTKCSIKDTNATISTLS